jgi:hypothetical protein
MAMMATLHIKPVSLEAVRLVKEVNLLCGDLEQMAALRGSS